jgi:hypothetical protein
VILQESPVEVRRRAGQLKILVAALIAEHLGQPLAGLDLNGARVSFPGLGVPGIVHDVLDQARLDVHVSDDHVVLGAHQRLSVLRVALVVRVVDEDPPVDDALVSADLADVVGQDDAEFEDPVELAVQAGRLDVDPGESRVIVGEGNPHLIGPDFQRRTLHPEGEGVFLELGHYFAPYRFWQYSTKSL